MSFSQFILLTIAIATSTAWVFTQAMGVSGPTDPPSLLADLATTTPPASSTERFARELATQPQMAKALTQPLAQPLAAPEAPSPTVGSLQNSLAIIQASREDPAQRATAPFLLREELALLSEDEKGHLAEQVRMALNELAQEEASDWLNLYLLLEKDPQRSEEAIAQFAPRV